MIIIEPNGLYTRSDLAEMLAPAGVDVDTFIARIRARKVFRALWLGEDILNGLRTAPSLAERDGAADPELLSALRSRGKRGRTRRLTKHTDNELSSLERLAKGER